MSLLDTDERLIALAPLIDLVYGPLVDIKEFPENVDVTLVEGAISSEEDLHKIGVVRARTRILVSLGDCAVTGNVPAMRNEFGVDAVLRRAYIENAGSDAHIPRDIIPPLLPNARPVHEVAAGGRFRPRLSAIGRLDLFGAERTSGRARPESGRQIWLERNWIEPCHGKKS